MSSYYDTMQVCRKGHQITTMFDFSPQHGQKFCDICGSKTIFACESCTENIPGYYHVSGVIGFPGPEVPLNCHNCGSAYPWKMRLILTKIGKTITSYLKYIVDYIVSFIKSFLL